MSLLPLQQIPRVSTRDRVLSFISDQKRRLPRFAADGLAAVAAPLHGLEAPTAHAPPSPQLLLNTPLLVPRAAKPREPVPVSALPKSTSEERSERSKEQRAPPPVDEHAERLAERRERRRERQEILHPKPTAGTSKRKRSSKLDESDEDADNNQTQKGKKGKSKKGVKLPAGMALMQNFSAPNFASGRLTLANQAGSASGMFSKGKASAMMVTKNKQVSKPDVRRGPLFDEHKFLNRKPLVTVTNSSPRKLKSNSSSSSNLSHKQSRSVTDSPQRSHHPSKYRSMGSPTSAHLDNSRREIKPIVTASPNREQSPTWSVGPDLLSGTNSAAAPASQMAAPIKLPTPALPATPAINDIKFVDTQYLLALPMCADISGPLPVATSAAAPAPIASSRPITPSTEYSAFLVQQQQPGNCVPISPQSLLLEKCSTPSDEAVPSDILCSDYPDPLINDEAISNAADHLLNSINRILDPIDLPPAEHAQLYETDDGMVLSDDLVMDEFDDVEEHSYIPPRHGWYMEGRHSAGECEEEHCWTGDDGGDEQLPTDGDEDFAGDEMSRWDLDQPNDHLEVYAGSEQAWVSDDLDTFMVERGTMHEGTAMSEIADAESENEWQEFTEGRALLLLGPETRFKAAEYDEGVKFNWSPYNRA